MITKDTKRSKRTKKNVRLSAREFRSLRLSRLRPSAQCELGPGFLESIYRKAMYLELDAGRMRYERERPVRVSYRGVDIPGQRVDLIIEGLIVVELKSVVRLADVHRAQLISYLRTTGLRGGLLINFAERRLKDGIKRVVL